MAVPPSASPFAGTTLEGMEHMFGNIIIDDGATTTFYQPSRASPPFTKIPERVRCVVPLEIRGKALFAQEDIAAGDLIYKIDQPLLNIVSRVC